MKYRITLSLLFSFLFSISLQAQRQKVKSDFTKKNMFSFDTRMPTEFRADKDTLFNPVFFDDCAADELSIFGAGGDWGTVSGMNSYGDKEKAQRLTSNTFSTYQINWVALFFAFADGDDGDVFIRIYEAGADGSPTNEVGSQLIRASDIQINDSLVVPTIIMFDDPPIVTTNEFFVSVDFEALYASETSEVALLNTLNGCGSGADTWEQWSDDSWNSFNDAWEDVNVDLLVIAEVEEAETSSTNDIYAVHSQAFPLPATDQVNIAYELSEKNDIQIQVYGVDGQLVYHQYFPDQLPGQQSQAIDLEDWNSGIYLYHIKADHQHSSGKIVVK